MEDNRTGVISDFRLITEYRAAIMGFSILWVVLFHSSIMISLEPLSTFQELGFGGVDIFLFLSGMGIFQSLQRNSISAFFKHRLDKIVPVWWSYLIIRLIVEKVHLGVTPSLKEVLGFASFTGYWAQLQHQGNWYVYAIMLFYALSPLLATFVNLAGQKKNIGPLLISAAILMSVSFYGQKQLMAASRIPVFLLGMLFSARAEKQPDSDLVIWLRRICFLLGGTVLVILIKNRSIQDLQYTGFCWYPFLFVTPELTLILAHCFRFFSGKIKAVVSLFEFLGVASLEILLTSDSIMQWTGDWTDGKLISFSIAAISVVLGLVYHFVIERMKKQFRIIMGERG